MTSQETLLSGEWGVGSGEWVVGEEGAFDEPLGVWGCRGKMCFFHLLRLGPSLLRSLGVERLNFDTIAYLQT
ncbi:MAG: hypothetical protein DSM106950_38255 [Stigonema ocellatum SAG 48.90 = DSM 106950]|nr:hypothetical protein [Stigonema ocellatum SAG 48.90 = DSM 106950]